MNILTMFSRTFCEKLKVWYINDKFVKRSEDIMFGITELAAEKVKEVLKNQNKEDAFLRLYLVGVG